MRSDEESTASSMTSGSNDYETHNPVRRKRGRPRKTGTPQAPQHHINPMIFNSPLGYQYNPMLRDVGVFLPPMEHGFYNRVSYVPGYSIGFPQHVYNTHPQYPPHQQQQMYEMQQRKVEKSEERNAYIPEKRVKRSAAVIKRVPEPEDSDSSVEYVEEEEDAIEKLLKYDEEKDSYYVKFRHQSYLHCDWVPKEEIVSTKVGAIKVKRFKPAEVPFDPEFLKVDRVIHEDYDGEKIFLVKWCKQPYELATFETAENVTKCEGFEEELRKYRDRKKMRNMRVSVDWRPPREALIKYEESPVFKGGNKLRAYQLEGLNWLLNRWYFKQSCIMADEMGLGKTVQSVSFVNTLFTRYDFCAPVLIVAPLSTIVHWEREFAAWSDLRVLTYHGSLAGRSLIADYEFVFRKNDLEIRLFDVLITTYEMVMAGQEHLAQFNYSVGIFDEAHRLKNANSKASKTLRMFRFNHKILLSGTPLQNNITELWSLLNFIDSLKFPNLNNFLEEFKMENINDVEKLQQLLRPLMLRRMKEDVEKSIPMKEETIIEVELTMIQKRFYRAILEKNIEFLTKGGKETAPNLLNAMMELRKCCIHPYLIKGAEQQILASYMKRKQKEIQNNREGEEQGNETMITEGSRPITPVGAEAPTVMNDLDEYYKVFIQSSGKLVLLDKLLGKLKNDHRVLIFSQMTKCLDLLAEYLTYRKYKFERIDGGVRGENRQAAIDRFSDKKSDCFVFLLCTRAGGVGINLIAADTVIIFDSDWNPQNDLQAQARCHRIGQTNEVKIYRLITRNTYEREMFDKAGLKLGLDRAVLQRMTFEEQKSEKTRKKDAIEILLRKGAYGVLMETDDASRKFCEEDIDQILERRTKVIKHADGGNVFSKASFQVEEEIDDPDFWENLLNKKMNEENEGRVKRQMRRLARDGGLSEEDIVEIEDYFKITIDSEDDTVFFENQCLIMFLSILRYGISSVGLQLVDIEGLTNKGIAIKDEAKVYVNPETHKFKDTLLYFKYLVKYMVDQQKNAKIRADFSVGLESYLDENYDPSILNKYEALYKKFGEKFILRTQVVLILNELLKTEELDVDKVRGWVKDDDKKLVGTILNHGYDNYPLTVRNKSVEDMNQRIRKIVSTLHKKKDMRENDNLIYRTIMTFGQITETNEQNVVKFMGEKDITGLKELIKKVLNEPKRHKLTSMELDCLDRINWFIRLESLDPMPTPKRGVLPKNWTVKTLTDLRTQLLTTGFVDIAAKYEVNDDFIVKKFDAVSGIGKSK